jgi:hypothetical protein
MFSNPRLNHRAGCGSTVSVRLISWLYENAIVAAYTDDSSSTTDPANSAIFQSAYPGHHFLNKSSRLNAAMSNACTPCTPPLQIIH